MEEGGSDDPPPTAEGLLRVGGSVFLKGVAPGRWAVLGFMTPGPWTAPTGLSGSLKKDTKLGFGKWIWEYLGGQMG